MRRFVVLSLPVFVFVGIVAVAYASVSYCTGICNPAQYREPSAAGVCGLGKYNNELDVTICQAKCNLVGGMGGASFWIDGDGCSLYNQEPTNQLCQDKSGPHGIYSYDVECDPVPFEAVPICPCDRLESDLPTAQVNVTDCTLEQCHN